MACKSELCESRVCRSLRPRKGLLGYRAGSCSLLGVHCRAWCLRQNGNRFKARFDPTLAASCMHERKPPNLSLSLLGVPHPIGTLHLQISNMGPACQSTALATVDTVFIITATAFLSLGSLFGSQRYGDTPSYPGVHQSSHSCSTTYSKNQHVIDLQWPTPVNCLCACSCLQLHIMINVGPWQLAILNLLAKLMGLVCCRPIR